MKYDPQVTAECYDKTAFHPLRIESITEQVRLLSRYPCQSVLEVGVGKGLIRQLFKCIPNIRYTCIDIAPDLEPDYVGSVLQMPFKDEEFDAILCCQVLEHLRLEDFLPALRELHRVSRRLVIMSLPDKRRRFGLAVCLFRFGWKKWEFNFHRKKASREHISAGHYWEIGHSSQTTMEAITDRIREAGFSIEENYRLERHQWHCVFVLRR